VNAEGAAFIEKESGTDLESLKACLSDDRISYGCFKVLGVDTRGAVVATRTKYCVFSWVGPNVNKLRVAKAVAHKTAMLKYFQGHHLSLELYDKGSLTEADIEKRLRDAGGAHQPSAMQFPGGGHPLKVVTELGDGEPSSPVPADAAAAAGGGAAAAPLPPPAPRPAPAPAKASPPAPAAPAGLSAAQQKKLAGASEAASDAVTAVGRAAARLGELLKGAEGGAVPVAQLEALVAAELAMAGLRAAACLASVGEVRGTSV
jgi:hypothetical protein